MLGLPALTLTGTVRDMKQERPPSTPFRRRIDRQGPDKTREREASDWAQDHRGKPAYKTAPSAGRAVSRLVKPLADRFGSLKFR